MKKNYGFTLFELLFTIAIVGILLAVALPSFSSLIKDSKLVNTINQFNSLTALARSEAIKRNNAVALCRSANGSTCSITGNNIIIKSDSNDNGVFTDATDEMLRVFELIESGSDLTLYFQDFSSSMITFTSNGAPLKSGHIEICDDRGADYAKATIINMGGQLRAINSDSSTGNTERNLITCV